MGVGAWVLVGTGMSEVRAVGPGTEVGDGEAVSVGSEVGVGSEAIVGTAVATAVVAGTAISAGVVAQPHATTNKTTMTTSPEASRPPYQCHEKPTHKVPLINPKRSSGTNPVEIRLSYLNN